MSTQLTEILAELASGRIPRESIPEDVPNAAELNRLIAYLTSVQKFTIALANGDLSVPLPAAKGVVSGSLKSLHASLKHLTWQTKQIAAGDFTQRVDFMGEFSDSFNTMVERLDESRTKFEEMNVQLQDDNIKLRTMAEALRESEERFRHIAENVSDVIWTLDSSMERFTYISPSIASLRGLSVDEALLEPLEHAMTPASLALLRNSLSRKIINHDFCGTVSESFEVEQICHDGRIINVEVVVSAITDMEGQLKDFVGVSRDITARKKMEEQLKHQSTHDAMTGLYNRAFFDAELDLVARGRQFPVSLVVADLDGLKQVNDTMGHGSGDALIKGAAAIFQMAFRGNDIIARTGGDEFVILLRDMDQMGAAAAINRVRSCTQLYNMDNGNLPVSLSLGAATASSGDELATALKLADDRMYADKAHRRQQRTD